MLGQFNPAIFHPSWLAANNLIRPEEAAIAESVTVRNEIATISKTWFELHVLDERFTIQTLDLRQYGPLRDLVIGVFNLLPHTPTTAIGLNKLFHVSIESEEAWHKIGHKLAPKESWNPILLNPGLRSMTMEGKRAEGTGGTLRIKVEPSTVVVPGLLVEFNEDYRYSKNDEPGAGWAVERIERNWDDIMKFADIGVRHIMELIKET